MSMSVGTKVAGHTQWHTNHGLSENKRAATKGPSWKCAMVCGLFHKLHSIRLPDESLYIFISLMYPLWMHERNKTITLKYRLI